MTRCGLVVLLLGSVACGGAGAPLVEPRAELRTHRYQIAATAEVDGDGGVTLTVRVRRVEACAGNRDCPGRYPSDAEVTVSGANGVGVALGPVGPGGVATTGIKPGLLAQMEAPFSIGVRAPSGLLLARFPASELDKAAEKLARGAPAHASNAPDSDDAQVDGGSGGSSNEEEEEEEEEQEEREEAASPNQAFWDRVVRDGPRLGDRGGQRAWKREATCKRAEEHASEVIGKRGVESAEVLRMREYDDRVHELVLFVRRNDEAGVLASCTFEAVVRSSQLSPSTTGGARVRIWGVWGHRDGLNPLMLASAAELDPLPPGE